MKNLLRFPILERTNIRQMLTDSCEILNKLLKWNLVLADRGFTIVEDMMLQQVQLAIPALTKGEDQLYLVVIEGTRGIAKVRIHVERVLGLLCRKCPILSGILPIDFLMSHPNDSKEEATPVIDRIINASICSSC